MFNFSQEKEELLQQNAELRVKLEAKVGTISKVGGTILVL